MPEDQAFSSWVRTYNGLAFLHPQWRLLYISIPKAAGTSLNVALTRSAGVSFPGLFLGSLGEESLVSQTIWDGHAGGRPMVDLPLGQPGANFPEGCSLRSRVHPCMLRHR